MAAITDLATETGAPASGDYLVLHDVSAATDKKMTVATFSTKPTGRVYPADAQLMTDNSYQYLSDWITEPTGVGLLIVFDWSNQYAAGFVLRTTPQTTVEAFDPSNHFSATAGTASSVNVYHDGVSHFIIENKTGGSTYINLTMIGL